MSGPRSNTGAIVRVTGRPDGGFSTVPNSVFFFREISPEARLVVAYLAGRPDGWVPIVGEICASLGVSRARWESVKRDLKRVGITPFGHPLRRQGTGGEFLWELEVDVGRFFLGCAGANSPGVKPAARPAARQRSARAQVEVAIGHHCTNSSNGAHCLPTVDGRIIDGQQAISNKKGETRKNHHPNPSGAGEESGGGESVFRGGGVPGTLLQVLDAAGVGVERRQVLLDELEGACAAALAAGRPVRSAVAYLRRLAALDADGGFAAEHAERIAQSRRDRAAAEQQAARQAAMRQPAPAARAKAAPLPRPSPARSKAQADLQKLRAEIRGGAAIR